MNQLRLLILSALVFSFLTACSNDDKTDKKDGKGGKIFGQRSSSPNQGQASVLKIYGDDGKPLAGAQVLVGSGNQNDLIQTGNDGSFEAPSYWVDRLPITISAPGYIRATYLAQTPHGQTFLLRRQEAGASYELNGLIPGVPLSGNKFADVVIAMPAFKIQDLFGFKMSMVVSSEKDQMTVIGQTTSVPSNVVFPRQNQSYGLIPVTLDKQRYRTFFQAQGLKKVYAIHGKFPFTQTIDKMRSGKQFAEVINDFQMLGGGIQDVNITSNNQTANLSANQMTFSSALSVVNGPAAPDEAMTGISLAEIQGYLVPTDIKSLTANGRDLLRAVSGKNMKVLTVVKRKAEMSGSAGANRMSITLVPFTDGVSSEALPIMEDPRVMSVNSVQVQKISSSRGVVPVATYATLSTVTSIASPIWEVYGPEWVDSIEIPNWPGESAPTAPAQGKLRWTVSLVAAAASHSDLDLGPSLIQNVSHVTNSSIDF